MLTGGSTFMTFPFLDLFSVSFATPNCFEEASVLGAFAITWLHIQDGGRKPIILPDCSN